MLGAAPLLALALALVATAPPPAAADPPAELVRAAESGEAAAQYRLGRLYERGDGVARDDAAAARWVRKAAENGHAKAALDYGWMLANGYGVARDRAAAYYWFARAAAAGVSGAAAQRDHVGRKLAPEVRARQESRVRELTVTPAEAAGAGGESGESGSVATRDLRDIGALRRAYNAADGAPDEALRAAIRRLAERGDPLAQNLMGLMRLRAGNREGRAAALGWFRSAAFQGLPAAQYNLADALAAGVAGRKDLPQALRLLEDAAAGLPSAGSKPSYERATREFAERAEYDDPYRAAMQGYRSAFDELRELIRLRRSEVTARLEMARRQGQ